jgi:hypothetical protein
MRHLPYDGRHLDLLTKPLPGDRFKYPRLAAAKEMMHRYRPATRELPFVL